MATLEKESYCRKQSAMASYFDAEDKKPGMMSTGLGEMAMSSKVPALFADAARLCTTGPSLDACTLRALRVAPGRCTRGDAERQAAAAIVCA